MKKIHPIKILGFLFILIALILNPFFLEQFSPDKQLDINNLLDIIIFDIFSIILGIIFLSGFTKFFPEFWKKFTQNILLAIVSIILLIVVLEISFYFLEKKIYSVNSFVRYNNTRSHKIIYNKNLGYTELPSSLLNIKKYKNNRSLIYDVNYIFDQFSRRKTEEKPGAPHLIIFGGSFAFGAGLENDQTLPYFLSELTDHQVYNYALSGYGPQQMLAQIEDKSFPDEISNQDGIAIYVFMSYHIRRAIGDMFFTNTSSYSPYYYLDRKNEVVRRGNFTTGRPIISWFYRILWKSNTLKYFNINLPPERKKHVHLTYKIIEKSKNIYEEKFNGTFYVLVHPVSKDDISSKNLVSLLKENDINVLQYPIEYSEEYQIPNDNYNHPNGKFNEILANSVVNYLNKK